MWLYQKMCRIAVIILIGLNEAKSVAGKILVASTCLHVVADI